MAARVDGGFGMYLAPDSAHPPKLLGVITAFFDDPDEPLVLFTPMAASDELHCGLAALFRQRTFDAVFLDENNREVMCAQVRLQNPEVCLPEFERSGFADFRVEDTFDRLRAMGDWFRRRVAADDKAALRFSIDRKAYSDDLVVIDARPEAYDFHGASGNVSMNRLERMEPGRFQERDTVEIMKRVFAAEDVYLNPTRTDTGKELVDVLGCDDSCLVAVQGKDSPNTVASLRRTTERKRSVARRHVEKAAKQLGGAMSHILKGGVLSVSTDGVEHRVAVAGKHVFGVVMVQELFDDDYEYCSIPVLEIASKLKAPCVLLEFFSLHMLTLRAASPAQLAYGLHQIFEAGVEHSQYPKPLVLGNR